MSESIPPMTPEEEAEIRRIVGTHWVRQERGERWACLLLLAEVDRLKNRIEELGDELKRVRGINSSLVDAVTMLQESDD